jgi:hypothetical protein
MASVLTHPGIAVVVTSIILGAPFKSNVPLGVFDDHKPAPQMPSKLDFKLEGEALEEDAALAEIFFQASEGDRVHHLRHYGGQIPVGAAFIARPMCLSTRRLPLRPGWSGCDGFYCAIKGRLLHADE